jgi:hypothetical protein
LLGADTIGSMSGDRQRRVVIVALSAFAITGPFGPGADAAPPYGQVSFSEPSLFPTFGPYVRDYVVRCRNGPVTVKAHASRPWWVSIGNHPYRRGDFSETVPLSTGRAFTVTAKRDASTQLYRYYVRCLPSNFPKYSFIRYGPASPKYFSVDQAFFVPYDKRYAIIFDNRGVPIWWHRVPAKDPRVLAGGNILWFDLSSYRWEIHRLDGSLVRTVNTVGATANPHDLQLAGNGDYLVAAYVSQDHVDTSAYGGSSDATVVNAELQQVSAGGNLLWDWKSQDHISLAQTGRWWSWAVDNDYDILHWNSIEPAGESVIASFRHLDAVYKIRKSTGTIAWKLGGTKTTKSLEVVNDPRKYTLGAQHDARVLSDGTLTVLDNRSNLAHKTPRAVRYRIDQAAGTATLLQSITDPDVSSSACCGSARRLGNGDWLIDWGLPNGIGGYKPGGERTFLLTFDSTFSYRAEPVPVDAVSAQDLRQAMNAMYAQR